MLFSQNKLTILSEFFLSKKIHTFISAQPSVRPTSLKFLFKASNISFSRVQNAAASRRTVDKTADHELPIC